MNFLVPQRKILDYLLAAPNGRTLTVKTGWILDGANMRFVPADPA